MCGIIGEEIISLIEDSINEEDVEKALSKYEDKEKLSNFLIPNCSIDINIVLNDYKKLDIEEFEKIYRL